MRSRLGRVMWPARRRRKLLPVPAMVSAVSPMPAASAMLLALLVLPMVAGGCVVAARPLTPPPNDETTVALLTGTLGPPLNGIARHPWFAVRRKGEEDWRVYEVPYISVERDPFRKHDAYGSPTIASSMLRRSLSSTIGGAPPSMKTPRIG